MHGNFLIMSLTVGGTWLTKRDATVMTVGGIKTIGRYIFVVSELGKIFAIFYNTRKVTQLLIMG